MKNLAARLPETTQQDHLENKETASEETESPGLDFWSSKLSQSGLWVQRTTVNISSLIGENHAGAISENVTTPEEARQENQKELTEAETMRKLQKIEQLLRRTQGTADRIIRRQRQTEDHKFPFSQFNPI